MKNRFIVLLLLGVIVLIFSIFNNQPSNNSSSLNLLPQKDPHPLSIEAMRKKDYPGSEIKIVETLSPGSNYDQYIASYQSDGLTIRALLTIPQGEKPEKGWPVIIFNHGYISPEVYRTNERYVAYVDGFASRGYIVFKPDYRGNGESEGEPEGAYYSPAYTVDILNALSSIKKYKDADLEKIGMWGHSLGGNIALRSLVINIKDIKAAVIWGGVVGSYSELIHNWRRGAPFTPSSREQAVRSRRQRFIDQYGDPSKNSEFWNSIDPTNFIKDITAPMQIHTGEDDEVVPADFSRSLRDRLQKSGKKVEYFEYSGGDHNISQSFNSAMENSVRFFNTYLK